MKNLILITILALSVNIVMAHRHQTFDPYGGSIFYFTLSDTTLLEGTNANILQLTYDGKYRYRQEGYLSGLYLNMGLGISKSMIMGIGLNFFCSNNWGASLSCNYYTLDANELPSNFTGGFTYFKNPTDHIVSYSIRLLKEFPTSYDQKRFGVEGGISVVEYQRAHFIYKPGTALINFNSNYLVSYTKMYSMGLSFRAKLEFPFTRIWGMEIALISNINEYQSYVGVELNTTLGLLRD